MSALALPRLSLPQPPGRGLRVSGVPACQPEGRAYVINVDPRDGASGVFRDAPVVVTVSHPLAPASVTAETVFVEAGGEPVPGHLYLTPDAAVVIWVAACSLRPEVEHRVRAEGLRDWRGLPVEPHESRFVPCCFDIDDVFG